MGPLRDPDISLLQTEFRRAYIETLDDLGPLNMKKTITFVHNLLDKDSEAAGKVSRDVQSVDHFWVVQVIGSYEREETEDHDPNGEKATFGNSPGNTDGPCHIYLEVIRDFAKNTTMGKAVDALTFEKRTVLHEVIHRFQIYHTEDKSGPGDKGPLIPQNNVFGSDTDNQLTNEQLDLIRKVARPK